MQRFLFQVYCISMKKIETHLQMPNTVTDMLVKKQKHANTAFFKKKNASPANQLAQNCGWFMVITDFTPFNYRSCQGVQSYSRNCSCLPDFAAQRLELGWPRTGIGLGVTITCWSQGWGRCPALPPASPLHILYEVIRENKHKDFTSSSL